MNERNGFSARGGAVFFGGCSAMNPSGRRTGRPVVASGEFRFETNIQKC